jgi:uncharacterized membrane protein YgcG
MRMPETFHTQPVSDFSMRPNWTLRQLLALLRGIALMVALFWGLILLQLIPALVRGGLAGVRDHIERVATAGVSPERWSIAVIRMYEVLGATFLLGCLLFLAQRYLGRRLNGVRGGTGQRMTYSNSSPS